MGYNRYSLELMGDEDSSEDEDSPFEVFELSNGQFLFITPKELADF